MPQRSAFLLSYQFSSRASHSLQNTYLLCNQSEKTLQLIRLLKCETAHGGSGKFIAYFSTCAAVEYFYRVSLG
jgi:ATP-dependent RNA helicase DDX55/SPB4